ALSSLWALGNLDLYVWIIRNYRDIDPSILENTHLTIREGILALISRSLVVAAWSASSGFALASLSRRTIWTTGVLFSLALIGAGQLPFISRGRAPYLWPMLLQMLLVLPPSIWGMRQALDPAARTIGKVILWAAAILTALAARNWFWPPAHMSWQMRLLLLPKYWPLVYMLATRIRWTRFKEKHA